MWDLFKQIALLILFVEEHIFSWFSPPLWELHVFVCECVVIQQNESMSLRYIPFSYYSSSSRVVLVAHFLVLFRLLPCGKNNKNKKMPNIGDTDSLLFSRCSQMIFKRRNSTLSKEKRRMMLLPTQTST